MYRYISQIFECSDAEELGWDTVPGTSKLPRIWTVKKSSSGLKLQLDSTQVLTYDFIDEPNCKSKYQQDIKFVSFHGFKDKTTDPEYYIVGGS